MIKNKDLRFIKFAKDISKCSDFKKTKLGACIVLKDDILSVGYNTNKTHSLQEKYNIFRNFDEQDNVIAKCHAEINAISKLPYFIHENNFDMKNSTIYIFRQHKDTNEYALAYPCAACYQALLDIGIGRIVYTCENGIKEKIIKYK